jgi:propionyl-CoA carboxylase alpha chain
MDIPIYYDPMIAKLIAHGTNRQEAIDRMVRAIDDYRITGIQTTLDFCRFALVHEAFQSGNFDTKFVERYFTPELLEPSFTEEEKVLLAALAVEFFEKEDRKIHPKEALSTTPTTQWITRKS